LILTLAIVIGVYSYRRAEDQRSIVNLQNQTASLQQTIEIKNGLFEKQALVTASVKDELDSTNAQNQALLAQLKKTGQQLADETSLNITLKSQLTSSVTATQTTVSPTSTGATLTNSRIRVDFTHDFGIYSVKGYTLTNPPEGQVTLTQTQPLKLSVVVAKDKNGVFETYVTSSDNSVNVNIATSAYDSEINAPHWYEKIGVQGSFGIGSTSNGAGILAGIGPTFDFGSKQQFTAGPLVWFDITTNVSKYFGASFIWRPFTK